MSISDWSSDVCSSDLYPHDAAAHVLGYVDEVTEGDIKRSNNFYRQGDYIGRSGIERAYEEVIRGHRGVYFELVDAFNRPKGRFRSEERRVGKEWVSTFRLRGVPFH